MIGKYTLVWLVVSFLILRRCSRQVDGVITTRYAGTLESWVVLPELGYLIITRDGSEMDTTGGMKLLLIKITGRVTYSARIAAVPSECRADNVNGSCTVWHSNMPHTPDPEI